MIRQPVPRQGTKDRIKFDLLTQPRGATGQIAPPNHATLRY